MIKFVDAEKVRQLGKTYQDFHDFGVNYQFPELIDIGDIWINNNLSMREKIECIKNGNNLNNVSKYLTKFVKKLANYEVWLVDGEAVRKIDSEFIQGGHHLRFKFIPKNHIWIDNTAKDIDPIILHEYFEALKMSQGEDYDNAHEQATTVEFMARHPGIEWALPLIDVRTKLNILPLINKLNGNREDNTPVLNHVAAVTKNLYRKLPTQSALLTGLLHDICYEDDIDNHAELAAELAAPAISHLPDADLILHAIAIHEDDDPDIQSGLDKMLIEADKEAE